MDDKLFELHNLSGKILVSFNKSTSSQEDGFMPEFHHKVKLTQQNLDRLAENNQKLEQTLQKLLNKSQDLSVQLQEIIMWNQKQHLEIKEIINQVAQDVNASQQNQSYEPETQWKVNQLNALKTKALDLAKANLFLYIRYKKELLDQLKICQDSKSVQEIEKKQQFIENYIDQLILLLEIQENMIDNIEINLMNAQDYVQAIGRPLDHVRQFRSTWKKKCLVILVVICIFVMIILLSFLN